MKIFHSKDSHGITVGKGKGVDHWMRWKEGADEDIGFCI